MTALAPTLQAFFTDGSSGQRQASPHTIAGYRDTFRLLLRFATDRTRTPACELDFADLDAPLIAAFLTTWRHERGNSVRTRNHRLAAIHSLFGYAALRHPEHAASSTGPGHPAQAVRTQPGHLPHRRRGRRPARRLRPIHLDRAPRPRHDHTRRPDRATDLRADRLDLRRRRPRRRRARPLPRQRPQATAHPAAARRPSTSCATGSAERHGDPDRRRCSRPAPAAR